MRASEPVRFESALLADGIFCVVTGLIVAARSGWLQDALNIPEEWLIVAAGLVTAVWGAVLVIAARFSASRSVMRAVTAVNGIVVLGALVWLAIGGSLMTAGGASVVAVLAACVLGFATYQAVVLRR